MMQDGHPFQLLAAGCLDLTRWRADMRKENLYKWLGSDLDQMFIVCHAEIVW
jgi:hypothetical protein